jgi:hypothetical protein
MCQGSNPSRPAEWSAAGDVYFQAQNGPSAVRNLQERIREGGKQKSTAGAVLSKN